MGYSDTPDIPPTGPPVGDKSFDEFYYRNCCGKPYVRNDEWLAFFGGIAARIVSDLQPTRVLDAGCALGLLVETLRERGVEAFGLDLSTYAIEHVHPSVKPFCWHGSVADPLAERYDLIVSIEVVEHMPARDAERAIENFCAHTDQVLFSSSPLDHREPTHINVQPTDYWAEQFARWGLYRDVDFDASFLTSWAILFRRMGEPFHRLVKNYERRFWDLQCRESGARSYSIEIQDRLTRTEAERDRVLAEHTALVAEHASLVAGHTNLVAEHTNLAAAHASLIDERAAAVAERATLVAEHANTVAEHAHAASEARTHAAALAAAERVAAQTIANMQRSVFWRIRNGYLAVRRLFQRDAS